ncbi:MAG: hypothetical protein AAF512_18345, partial [Pseudomonadota bacterium]
MYWSPRCILFCLLLFTLLSAYRVEAVTLTKAVTPTTPLAANEVAWVDFEFEGGESCLQTGRCQTLFIQVPANWTVVAGYIGITGEMTQMYRGEAPSNLTPETGLAAPMQMVTFNLPSFSHHYPDPNGRLRVPSTVRTRVLFIPALTQGRAGTGIQTFAQNLKAVFAGAFPPEMTGDSFNNAPLPVVVPSTDLKFSGEVLTAEGASPNIHASYHYEDLGDVIPTPFHDDVISFLLPADANLRNRYGWRIFFSNDKQFGGVSGTIGGGIESRHDRDKLVLSASLADAGPAEGYSIDVPVFPGKVLDVNLHNALWLYIKAVPLTAQSEALSAIDARAETLSPVAGLAKVSGKVFLPKGQTAPAGGMKFQLVKGIHPPSLVLILPEGQNTLHYETVVPQGHSIGVRCVDNCGNIINDTHFYTPTSTVFDIHDGTQIHNETAQNIDIQLKTMAPITISGTLRINETPLAFPESTRTVTITASTHPPMEVEITLPRGENTAHYRLEGVVETNSSFTIYADCRTGCSAIARNKHYYNENGTANRVQNATSLNSAGTHESIDIILETTPWITVNGQVHLPEGYTAPPGGAELLVSINYSSLIFQGRAISSTNLAISDRLHIATGSGGSHAYQLSGFFEQLYDNFRPLYANRTPQKNPDYSWGISVQCINNCQGLNDHTHYYSAANTLLSPSDAQSLNAHASYTDIELQVQALDPLTTGHLIAEALGIQATIQTREAGLINAAWRQGGDAWTARGDRVIWGFFHADPNDVEWGSADNPEVFVKIWFDVGGQIDINYFHVSVPTIRVFSAYQGIDTAQLDLRTNTTSWYSRYVRHTFYPDGTSRAERQRETGSSPGHTVSDTRTPPRYATLNNLNIGSLINSEAGLLDGVWRLGGQGLTERGDEVAWGFFHADPNDVDWGSADNPEVFVKIWFDVTGKLDVNYFHASVPDIWVYSD